MLFFKKGSEKQHKSIVEELSFEWSYYRILYYSLKIEKHYMT